MYVCVHAAGHEKVAALFIIDPRPSSYSIAPFWILDYEFPISNFQFPIFRCVAQDPRSAAATLFLYNKNCDEEHWNQQNIEIII